MQTRPPPAPRPRDLGKLAARLFCALFALVGAVPFGAGLLVRVAAVQDWAKAEAARILDRELGVRADYDVRMQAWPLRVALENVVVPASDGKGPVLRADAVAVEPKLFSLLAGRLDVGDVEIERPRVRVVLRDGKLKNLRYRSFDRPDSGQALERAPFSSLAVTEAFVAADVDGLEVESEGIDIDVFAEDNWVFEAALRVGQTRFARRRPLLEPGKPAARAVDDDVLCRLDLRLRSEPGDLLILRFSALGVADDRPAPNTAPSCERALAREDPSRVALRLSQLRVRYPENRPTLIDGHVLVQAPASLTNRFVRTMPLTGSASFAGNVRFDSASRLPELRGRVRGSGIAFGGYRLAAELDADVVLNGEVIKVPRYFMRFADGRVRLTNAEIRPLAPGVPIKVERVDGDGMQFEGLMRDLDVTPDTIVQWRLTDTRVTGIDGTLNPLQLDAALSAETRDFEVFDRSFRDEHRSHMIGVKAARVKGKLRVVPEAFQIRDAAVSFGKSSLFVKLVSIGFANEIELDVAKGSKIDLSDVSPLVDIPMAGKAELGVEMSGLASDPVLTGQAKILGFELGGFPLGDVLESQLKFRPLVLELSDVKARKGKSPYLASSARLDFGGAATIEADAAVQSPGMSLRDFFAMWHFDADPRFADLDGTGAVESRVRYALGGPEDRCGGGRLRVTGSARFEPLDMFEERYDSAQADFDFHWIDRDASYLGIELDVPNVTLRKGPGVLLGSFHMRPGAEVRGQMVGTALPLSKLDAFGALGPLLDAEIGAVAEVGGTLDSLTALVNAQLSPLRAGQGTFPASELTVRLDPIARPPNVVGKTRCGRPKPGEFDAPEWKQDRPQGTFVASGQLFGGQIAFSDLHVSRQRSKVVRGELALRGLDVGAAAALASFGGGEKSALSGELSGRVTLDTFYMQRAAASTASLDLRELSLKKNGVTLAVAPGKNRIALRDGRLELPSLALSVKTPFGHSAVFDVKGAARDLTGDPKLEAELVLRPVPLETFANLLPRIEKAKGTVRGSMKLSGRVARPSYRGSLQVEGGELWVHGLPSALDDLNVLVLLDNDEVRIEHARAKLGSGRLELKGSAPLRGFELGALRAELAARDLSLPLGDGVQSAFDADLDVTWAPTSEASRNLPRITGDVTVKRFAYTRPVKLAADLTTLTQRGKRTEFESYDPAEDQIDFDLSLRSNIPLGIQNSLADAELVIQPGGLRVAGTNQRFGVLGTFAIKPGGTIQLRNSEFEIQEGSVRFSDPARIAPEVDVRAVTEYRRYSESLASAETTDASNRAGSAQGGRWTITMHAYGDAEKLKVDLTSEPALAQDDIFLLLTVGLTRAELDQAQSASVGGSVALEALGALTGADRAVESAVPVIDDFRFGSAYSSRTGRTEPTVTISKRLAQRIHANITSGLTDSREIRSNLEWKLSPRVSVEGSYDNVNDISSSALGNLGADIRWRLEFE